MIWRGSTRILEKRVEKTIFADFYKLKTSCPRHFAGQFRLSPINNGVSENGKGTPAILARSTLPRLANNPPKQAPGKQGKHTRNTCRRSISNGTTNSMTGNVRSAARTLAAGKVRYFFQDLSHLEQYWRDRKDTQPRTKSNQLTVPSYQKGCEARADPIVL